MRSVPLLSSLALVIACGSSGADNGAPDAGSAVGGGDSGAGASAATGGSSAGGGSAGDAGAQSSGGGSAGAGAGSAGLGGASGSSAVDGGVPGPCGATCGGCCENGVCLAGTSDTACGAMNEQCVACASGSACRFTKTQFECVVLKKDGEPCSMGYECAGSVCDLFDGKCKSACAGIGEYCGSTPCCVAHASCVVPKNDFFGRCCIPKGGATPSCYSCCDPSAGCNQDPNGSGWICG